jgi:hypothetical protein
MMRPILLAALALILTATEAEARGNLSLKTPRDVLIFFVCLVGCFAWWLWGKGSDKNP